MAAPYNQVPQTGGDGEPPPPQPRRHKSFGTVGGQGAVAAKDVSPVVAMASQDQPHANGPLGIAHKPAEEVGEVVQEGDHDRPVMFPVPLVDVPTGGKVAHVWEAAPGCYSMELPVRGVLELVFPRRRPPLWRLPGGAGSWFLPVLIHPLQVGAVVVAVTSLNALRLDERLGQLPGCLQ